MQDRVGGIVEHLTDDLATDPRVRAPLDLDERRHAILIEEQVIERPPSWPTRLWGDRLFTVDEEKSARVRAVHLIARQQRGEAREQILKVVFRGETRRLHRNERVRFIQYKYSGLGVHVRHPVLISGPRRVSVIEIRARASTTRDRSEARGSRTDCELLASEQVKTVNVVSTHR
jgi:hypothetical protein